MQISERARSGIDAKQIKERLAHKVRRLSLENEKLRKLVSDVVESETEHETQWNKDARKALNI